MNGSFSPNSLSERNGQATSMPLLQIPQMPWAQTDELDLKRLLAILRRRILAVTTVAAGVMGIALYTTLSQTPVYEGKFRVLVEPVNAENDVSQLTSALGAEGGKRSGLDYATQVQVLRSPDLMQAVVEELQKTYPDIDYGSLLNGLTITRLGETKILEVRYQDTDAVKIQVVLDELAETYLAYSLDERQTNLRQGIQFIDKQLPELKSRVSQLQLELEKFRRLNNFLDPETQTQQLATQVQQIQARRFELEQQMAQAQTRIQQMQTQDGSLAAIKDAPVYQSLIQELRGIETEIASELTRFQPNSLPIQVLQEKRNNLLPLIDREAQRVLETQVADANAQIDLLFAQSQTLEQAEGQLRQTLDKLPTLSREYSNLQRELQVATDALSRFLASRETLQIEAAQTEIPWQLIQAPNKPNKPISPDTQRSLMLGVIASLLLGVGAALLLEKLDNVYRTVDDLKTSAKLPLLGTIPFQKELVEAEARPSLTHRLGGWLGNSAGTEAVETPLSYGYGSAHLLESLRILNTNLQLLSSDRPIQSVIVSSAMPGDGKSTVAAHLAKTAATLGKRVLLVDTDMRRPKAHDKLGIPNPIGLSDLISGNLSKEEVMQQALPFTEFYAITAGQIPPDPVKLLSSQKMQQLIQEFEQDFDLVIYDAPPLVGLADASLLAPHTDGLLLVARINQTDRSVLKLALDNLKLTQTSILGLVANGVAAKSADGYKYYNYSYTTSDQNGRTTQTTANRRFVSMSSNGRAVANGHASTNGHAVTNGHASTNGHDDKSKGLSASDFIPVKDHQ